MDDHFDQPKGYCDAINNSYHPGLGPVRFFVLTNGLETRLFEIGRTVPTLTLAFHQFANNSPDYAQFLLLLDPGSFQTHIPLSQVDTITFTKPSIAEVNHVFAQCHQHIHQSDHISQGRGFEEFVKLIALKLTSDKEVRDAYPGAIAEKQFEHAAKGVKFSLRWVTDHEASTPNPVDSILFRDFMNNVEKQVATQLRKRFFSKDEKIRLKPATIRGVVSHLERLFLLGIDADLNGRLFEKFLSATMRGKDLGQYFTPRTVVKLGVGLGDLQPTDFVLDACCGTGGFLIDALSDMWSKVNSNASLTDQQKATQRSTIANEQIYGIDFAKGPNLAKIARLNMYLHGDGGSRVFNVDALDLKIHIDASDGAEDTAEKKELQDLELANRFDVVLTNPPFSKKYDRDKTGDAWVMDQYTVAKNRPSILAKVMFFEMYHQYLRPGGRLISVIDDGFLTGRSSRWFRQMLRRLYIVKAVISLPGDAFQRSEARVKTSFIVLEKRDPQILHGSDPAIFMYACRYVGIDDPKRRRTMPGDDLARENGRQEVERVVAEYKDFRRGQGSPEYVVANTAAAERLDVKHCLMERNERQTGWKQRNVATYALSDIVSLRKFGRTDTIECAVHSGYVQPLIVKYDGTAERGDAYLAKTDTQYNELYVVRKGDLVISNIAATYGSVTVVPDALDGTVVSKEYTVLRARRGFDARVVCALFRSTEIRAELLLSTTGANRTRIQWEDIRHIVFPYPDGATVGRVRAYIRKSERARMAAVTEGEAARQELNHTLGLDQDRARHILDAFKPPK